jgi:hypothetical protein
MNFGVNPSEHHVVVYGGGNRSLFQQRLGEASFKLHQRMRDNGSAQLE